jgi:hypothetical protein
MMEVLSVLESSVWREVVTDVSKWTDVKWWEPYQ